MRSLHLISFAVIFGMMISIGAFVSTSNANDAPGCEGLSNYRAQMLKAGRDFLKANEESLGDPDKDLFLYSSDDFTVAADNFLGLNRALKEITPPEFAKPWHQLQIDKSSLGEQVFRAMATGGIMMSLGFVDAIDANAAALDVSLKEGAKVCSDFTHFQHDWDALDGEIDGTPVATPVD